MDLSSWLKSFSDKQNQRRAAVASATDITEAKKVDNQEEFVVAHSATVLDTFQAAAGGSGGVLLTLRDGDVFDAHGNVLADDVDVLESEDLVQVHDRAALSRKRSRAWGDTTRYEDDDTNVRGAFRVKGDVVVDSTTGNGDLAELAALEGRVGAQVPASAAAPLQPVPLSEHLSAEDAQQARALGRTALSGPKMSSNRKARAAESVPGSDSSSAILNPISEQLSRRSLLVRQRRQAIQLQNAKAEALLEVGPATSQASDIPLDALFSGSLDSVVQVKEEDPVKALPVPTTELGTWSSAKAEDKAPDPHPVVAEQLKPMTAQSIVHGPSIPEPSKQEAAPVQNSSPATNSGDGSSVVRPESKAASSVLSYLRDLRKVQCSNESNMSRPKLR